MASGPNYILLLNVHPAHPHCQTKGPRRPPTAPPLSRPKRERHARMSSHTAGILTAHALAVRIGRPCDGAFVPAPLNLHLRPPSSHARPAETRALGVDAAGHGHRHTRRQTQCSGVTKAGTQCTRTVKAGPTEDDCYKGTFNPFSQHQPTQLTRQPPHETRQRHGHRPPLLR
jgi:hypothetical protein